MKIYIETDKFLLREIEFSDLDAMFELDSDPLIHKYLGNKPIKDKKQAEETIKFVRQQYLENGIGRWAIQEKENNEFVGWTGLKLVKETINNQSNYYDLGYRILRKHWGKAYASQSAKLSLDYAFNIMKINEIFAAAHIHNIASNKILQKLGFEYINTFDYDKSSHNWYRIDHNLLKDRKTE